MLEKREKVCPFFGVYNKQAEHVLIAFWRSNISVGHVDKATLRRAQLDLALETLTGSVILVCVQALKLSLAIPSRFGTLSTGNGFVHHWLSNLSSAQMWVLLAGRLAYWLIER